MSLQSAEPGLHAESHGQPGTALGPRQLGASLPLTTVWQAGDSPRGGFSSYGFGCFLLQCPSCCCQYFHHLPPQLQCSFQFIEMNKRTEIRGLARQRAYVKPLTLRLAHEMCWRNGISLPSLPKASCNSNEALLFSTSSLLSVAQTLLVSHP